MHSYCIFVAKAVRSGAATCGHAHCKGSHPRPGHLQGRPTAATSAYKSIARSQPIARLRQGLPTRGNHTRPGRRGSCPWAWLPLARVTLASEGSACRVGVACGHDARSLAGVPYEGSGARPPAGAAALTCGDGCSWADAREPHLRRGGGGCCWKRAKGLEFFPC
ncbi:hypothetical protein GW17_00049068 [Ensete ventricosum]|nr:hypothetical protein GW17_00049068 [Ensete ventricosum]